MFFDDLWHKDKENNAETDFYRKYTATPTFGKQESLANANVKRATAVHVLYKGRYRRNLSSVENPR